jgi:hypothetical protein
MIGLQFASQFWWKLAPVPFGVPIFLGMSAPNLLYALALYQIVLLLRLLAWPAFSDLTSCVHLGEQSSLSSTLFSCIARWRSWLWISIANWGIVLVLPEAVLAGTLIGFAYLLFAILKLNSVIQSEWLTPAVLLSIALCWAAFLWLSSALSISIPAWTTERLTVGKSLKRSWTLSKGSRWRILFTRFMIALISWILNLASYVIFILLAAFVMRSIGVRLDFHGSIYLGIRLLSAAVAYILTGPIFPIALTLFYYDQRIRKEGYDIERMMEDAGLIAPVTTLAEVKEGQA